MWQSQVLLVLSSPMATLPVKGAVHEIPLGFGFPVMQSMSDAGSQLETLQCKRHCQRKVNRLLSAPHLTLT